ncbi:MAG: glycosyltransferase family 4 protein [Planctomycetota bacterium]
MRILHVITRLILGGAQQNTVMSCAAQAAAGHDVHLAYGPIHGPEGSLLDEAKASGATLHEIPTMVRQIAPLTDWRCYRDLRKLVRDLRPDLVHTHSSKAGIAGRAAAWRERKWPPRNPQAPKELFDADSSRDVSIDLLNRMTSQYVREKAAVRPKVVHTVHGLPFHNEQSKLKHNLYVALERFAAKRCDHLIAITDAMVKAFLEEKIALRDKFTVIPSGVDLSRFDIAATPESAKQRLGLDPNRTAIGLVARLDPLKGHRDLIAALSMLDDSWPGDPPQVLFVGDGFDRQNIEREVSASPYRDWITMLHLVPFEQMPEVYRAIDVCVLPSYQEGQSRVLVEALASGCGIVAYDVGGIPEVCVDGQTGSLVRVGDTAALADSIVDLMHYPKLRAKLVEQGQAHVRENFSAEKMNRELLELYERLVDGGVVAYATRPKPRRLTRYDWMLCPSATPNAGPPT